MKGERLTKVIISPVISEKSTRVADSFKQFVFKVLKNATKTEIKHAIESLFSVKVTRVTTTAVPSKSRRFGRHIGKTQSWKKAYITLAEGHDINFVGVE